MTNLSFQLKIKGNESCEKKFNEKLTSDPTLHQKLAIAFANILSIGLQWDAEDKITISGFTFSQEEEK